MLPDEVLLKIFAFYLEEDNFYLMDLSIAAWHTLVHVCRTWRIVVLGSPRRLDLRLQCGTGRKRASAREMLDTFPLLPIVLQQYDDRTWDMDNIMAALEHKDRLCEITLRDASISPAEKVLAAMQEPFPALTNLQLHLNSAMTQVIPNSFLGGSAPHLQELTLHRIAFPGLRKLLSSTTHLVKLDLQRVPRSGYISPEAMVTCLSTLTSLEGLRLGFQFRESRNPPTLTRTVLPALIHFGFKGFSEYLEDFVARIDTPMLYGLEITFFHQPIFDTPNLPQFISRTPNLKARDTAGVLIADSGVWLVPEWPDEPYAGVGVEVPYSQSGWPSPFAHVCQSSFPPNFISSLENLYIRVHNYQLPWQGDPENLQENPQWLELLHPFTTVKNLYLPKEVYITYRARPSGARWGKSSRIIARTTGSFLGGSQPSRSCTKSYCAVRCCATALRSPYNRFSLEQRVIKGW
jgi:hypothetical protein